MVFISIIWNYFEELPVEIINFLNNRSPIEQIVLLDLTDSFEEFIFDIYSISHIRNEHLVNKISALVTLPSRTVIVITHSLLETLLVYNPIEQDFFSKSGKSLKKMIRDEFNQLFSCLPNNPIIHSTDNSNETKAAQNVLKKYYEFCHWEIIEKSTWLTAQ